jgi:hypothetical protein
MYSYPYGAYNAPGGYVTQQQPIYGQSYAPQSNPGYVTNPGYPQHGAPTMIRPSMAAPAPQPRVVYESAI